VHGLLLRGNVDAQLLATLRPAHHRSLKIPAPDVGFGFGQIAGRQCDQDATLAANLAVSGMNKLCNRLKRKSVPARTHSQAFCQLQARLAGITAIHRVWHRVAHFFRLRNF
jgi:hypothetical protein